MRMPLGSNFRPGPWVRRFPKRPFDPQRDLTDDLWRRSQVLAAPGPPPPRSQVRHGRTVRVRASERARVCCVAAEGKLRPPAMTSQEVASGADDDVTRGPSDGASDVTEELGAEVERGTSQQLYSTPVGCQRRTCRSVKAVVVTNEKL